MPLSLQRKSSLAWAIAVIFVAGLAAGIWRAAQTRNILLDGPLVETKRDAQAFEPGELQRLSGTRGDLTTPFYAEIANRLARLREIGPGVRFIRVLRVLPATGKIIFLADSGDGVSPDRFFPGDLFSTAAASPGLQTMLATGRPTTEGPIADPTGSRLGGYAFIGAPAAGRPREFLAIGLAADDWSRRLWTAGLGTAVYIWMLLVLPLVALVNTRRQLQQRDALRNLTEAIEQSHSSVIIVNLEGGIEFANAGFCRQLGYTRGELVGGKWHELQTAEVPSAVMSDLVAAIRAGRPWSGEWMMRHKDASLFPVRGGVTPVKDRAGKIHSYVAVFDDMTESRLTENVLREAKERAEAGDRAKGQFLATMSHEVRTPLNGVVGFASLLLDTELTPEQQEYVETIRTSSETLIQLTGDILDYARIDSGRLKLDPQPCDARECVENALDLVAATAVHKNIELLHWIDDTVPGAIVADVSRLRQVIVNLVNNAVKFTADGEVEVRVHALSADAVATSPAPTCVLEFSVRDTGIGIAPEHREKIFRPFSQADESTTRRYGGTGLGLAICKSIVELMDGAISFASEPGRGTTFVFTIRVPTHPTGDLQRPPPPLINQRLAVAVSGDGLRGELMRLGARLGAATIAVDPAALAATPGWDLAIIDVTGSLAMELAAARTARPNLPAEKIIGLVPVVLPGELRASLRTHLRLVLNKPLHHEMLYSLLASSSAGRVAPALTAPESGFNLRVLIVEDNAVNQRLIQKTMANLGCEWTAAVNGRAALEEIARERPDVVLMDLHMPEMDGLTATMKIRAGEAGAAAREVWIIALTADAREEQRDRTLAAGANDYLTKPVRLPELTKALRRFLAARHS